MELDEVGIHIVDRGRYRHQPYDTSDMLVHGSRTIRRREGSTQSIGHTLNASTLEKGKIEILRGATDDLNERY